MESIDADLVGILKDALKHLYDPAALAKHPLARLALPARLPVDTTLPQAVHDLLLDLIDELRFGSDLPVDARQRRAYEVLQLTYVEALPYRTVMQELGLSQAQYHRDLRHALEGLGTLLREHIVQVHQMSDSHGETVITEDDVVEAKWSNASAETDLRETIGGVVELLASIAPDRATELCYNLPQEQILVSGDRTTIRQLLICLASYLMDQTGAGRLEISCSQDQRYIMVSLRSSSNLLPTSTKAQEARERIGLAERLVVLLRGSLKVVDGTDGATVQVYLQRRAPHLLIIDDSEDVVQLIRRFLADGEYVIASAGTVADGLQMAEESHPDVVILDIMIPEQDGWDALQALKHNAVTKDIPVLVCTVLREERLALALGADEFIRKPLTRNALIEALARLVDSQSLPPHQPTDNPRVSGPNSTDH